jgi:hypothetical protein
MPGPARSDRSTQALKTKREDHLVSTMIANDDEHRAVVLFDPIFDENLDPGIDLLAHRKKKSGRSP